VTFFDIFFCFVLLLFSKRFRSAGIPKFSLHKEWAAKFIEHITSPDQLVLAAKLRSQVPATRPGFVLRANLSTACDLSRPSICDVPEPTMTIRPSTVTQIIIL
jgi:hypothetical protein